jgi:hypothetical protein
LDTGLTHLAGPTARTGTDLNLSSAYKLNNWFGAAGEIGVSYAGGTQLNSCLFGPQVSFSWAHRYATSFHFLVGPAHLSQNDWHGTSFASVIGGSVAIPVTPRFSWKIVQVDYMPTYLQSEKQNNVRVLTGFVLHF